MKAFVLVKNHQFELKEVPDKQVEKDGLLVKVTAFGLNFADIMAWKGMYNDRPPVPCILGYDIMGTVEKAGSPGLEHWIGKKVVAFTRFEGYAEYVCVSPHAVIPVENEATGKLTALATQYCTAYFACSIATHILPGEKVLIHSAGGGVGQALMEILSHRGAVCYGVVGNAGKAKLLQAAGFSNIIVRGTNGPWETLQQEVPDGFDAIFDAIGGKSVKNGLKLLKPGGRILCFGAATRNRNKNILKDIRMLLGFGFYSPVGLMLKSRGIIGINMLHIADARPEILLHCLQEVGKLWSHGALKVPFSEGFNASSHFQQAIEKLNSGTSAGKIYCEW